MFMPRVFIVAPTPALRAGLRALLAQGEPSWEAVGEDSTLAQASVPLAVDLFLLADPEPLWQLGAVLSGERTSSVLVLTDDIAVAGFLRALPLHGWAIVPPDASADEMRAAALAALQGLVAMPTDMADRTMARLPPAQPANEGALVAALPHPLTPREVEVLEWVSRGLPSKRIAHMLGVSESTVKFHLSSIYAKLGVTSRTEAVSRAARLGLLTL